MDGSLVFRRTLLDRLLLIAGVSSIAAGCGGAVVREDDASSESGSGGGGGAPGTTSTGGGRATTSVASSVASSPASSSSTGPYGCFPTSSSSSGGLTMVTACFPSEEPDGACPPPEEALPHFDWSVCAVSVDCGPLPELEGCCYVVATEPCVGGRPLRIEGRAVTARVQRSPGRGGWGSSVLLPRTAGLDADVRRELAARWLEDALFEHASIASFVRFAMDLLAVGAPAEMIEDALLGAADEVRHARACFALASGYAGESLGPSSLSVPVAPSGSIDLTSLAADTARDGCVNETIAATLAAERRARATDPAVRAALDTIARDETRHAELAWRFVTWAVARGGEAVRVAVEAALLEALAEVERAETADPPVARALDAQGRAALAAHGVLDRRSGSAASRRARLEVIAPCAVVVAGRVA